ncbi:MAG: class I SAM-dependent methyltransferase [Acidimicrobiales bacterium]
MDQARPHLVTAASPTPHARQEDHDARVQRKRWNRRVDSWEDVASPNLTRVVNAVIDAADVKPGEAVLDLGTGTGQLALPLAEAGASVTAVDVSPAMIDRLGIRASERGVAVRGMVCPIERLDMPDASVDLVVSNYVLHHLHDREKAAVVAKSARWLRPGGKIVIGDMMFGRGRTSGDRQVIAGKVMALAKRGPGGWWRVAKNAWRFTFRTTERPVSAEAWTSMLEDAGFVDIRITRVVAEAAVAVGQKAADPAATNHADTTLTDPHTADPHTADPHTAGTDGANPRNPQNG